MAASLALCVWLGACGDSSGHKPIPFTATAPDYQLSVFVTAPASTMKPDSIVLLGSSVYIGYQNAGDVKDGSNPALTNSVVQYDLKANLLKTYTVPGHVDGLLARSDTNELWAMANEDGNAELTIINLASGTQKTYQPTVNPPAHGGGFDDMQLFNGVIYVSASNPTTPGVGPTVVSLTLNSNGTTFDVAPVLDGSALALDITPSAGGTLFDDKDGPTLPVDDTRWVPAPGPPGNSFMLFTDANNTTYRVADANNTTYRVDRPLTSFKQGDAYSAGQGQVMQLDTTTGHLTPVVTGIGFAPALHDPHGMLFIP